MDPLFLSSSRSSEIDELLSRPYDMMPMLIESVNSDLIVYTHDLQRHLTFMSKSSWEVCRLDFRNWERKSFLPMFTDHPWNDIYKQIDDSKLNPSVIQKLYCEILTDEGGKARIETSRQLVMHRDEPVGIVGISRRISVLPPAQLGSVVTNTNPFCSLKPNEMEVIELVIDGEMNKSIAKKLGIAMRTVEMRRARAMTKLGVNTVTDLVKLWCRCQ
jgi:DNA-binding CsgD family transcriptional regulator